ncbi:hypothetical protein RISW2_19230 [Roseivivax isoporae LMG 25204]|uniref:Metal-binding protein n=2 Tax=Roseivivax TaxID=93682 RepID=X7F400_9RHOB|nr:DUF411 domain-containing protein [Roseivivax isoporae]ETX26799.1 hypothetical protein RISW2_19230 [Roseivivax isoporae LMG 25204]
MTHMTRRRLLVSATSLFGMMPFAAAAQDSAPTIHVVKDRNCGCCAAWVEILRNAGFTVTTEASMGTLLIRHKLENGIPQAMHSCHTGEVAGYMIEGHVPPADIRRLLAEHPDAIGLAVPDMPYGSPGMGPEYQREAYDVFLMRKDGSTDVFSRYEAA